LHPRVLT
jgi:hypothetical protein